MWCVHAHGFAILAHDLGWTGPYCFAADELRQAHDLTPPGLTCMGGVFTALEQVLMQHLVQQGVVVGQEEAAVRGQVESDGSATACQAVRVRAESDAATVGLGLGEDE